MLMILLALLCGTGAAILRGFQLARSFDPVTGLIPKNDPLTIFLAVFSVVFIIAAFLLPRRKKDISEKPVGDIWLVLELIAASALFISSGYALFDGIKEPRVSSICLGLLGLLAVFAIVQTALSANKPKTGTAKGFWATVPVFWACYILVLDFGKHASNPVRDAFVYEMLAMVFCTLALNSLANIFFGKDKRTMLVFHTLCGVYFAALTAGGSVFARVILRPASLAEAARLPLSKLLLLAFIALHLTALAVLAARGLLTPAEREEENAPDAVNESANSTETGGISE